MLTRTQALLATGYLARHDSDEILYHWPPPPQEDRDEGARLSAHAEEAFEAADQRGATQEDWAATVHWCEAEDVPDVERLI